MEKRCSKWMRLAILLNVTTLTIISANDNETETSTVEKILLTTIPPPSTTVQSPLVSPEPPTTVSCNEDSEFPPWQPLARRKKGKQSLARVIGLFDVHEGSRCHLLRPGGVKQVMATIGLFENSLIGSETSQIGFDIYDTCSNVSTSVLLLVGALTDFRTSMPNCANKSYIAVTGPTKPEVQLEIAGFLKSIDVPYFPFVTVSLREEIESVTEVLLDLKWKVVTVFSSTKTLEDEFRDEANKRNICIASSVILPSSIRYDTLLKMVLQDITLSGIQVAVVLGSAVDLNKLHRLAILTNSSLQYWLLVGVESVDSFRTVPLGSDHRVILFRKSTLGVPKFDNHTVENYEFSPKIQRLNLVQSYIEYINSCSKNVSSRASNDSRCEDHQMRLQNPQWSTTVQTVDRIINDMIKNDIISINADVNETDKTPFSDEGRNDTSVVEIWTYQNAMGKFSRYKEMQVGHYSRGNLIWDIKRLNIFRSMGSGWFKIPEFRCQRNCREICTNFYNISLIPNLDNLYSRIMHWKHETWVTILLTVSTFGIIIAFLIALYLIVRSCKEDFEDGNQISNVILLAAIIFSYCCTVLFMFHKDNASCSRRVTIVGLAYVSMLAPAISRCFLLIAAEMDGIQGHVSGFLQSILCVFIAAVQVAMASYYWLTFSDPRGPKFRCITDIKQTVTYLSYAMVLSFIWLIASPFCARCRRNNREGLLLHFGSIAVCLVWVIWYLLFFLLHSRWSEFTICFGLVSTASAILLVVFLPKVYRMVVSAAAKEHGQVSMQPVIFASSSSRSPNLSIYESVNHGYNPDKDGYVVDVFRDEDESPRPRKMTHL